MTEHEVKSPAAATTAQVFDGLRDALAEVIGTAATATFLRRAVRKAAMRSPELATIVITKHQLDYNYALPPRWSESRDDLPALAMLSGELENLLLELTGRVMVRKLRTVQLLLDAGLFQEGTERDDRRDD